MSVLVILASWDWQFWFYTGYVNFCNLKHPTVIQIAQNRFSHIVPTISLDDLFSSFLQSPIPTLYIFVKSVSWWMEWFSLQPAMHQNCLNWYNITHPFWGSINQFFFFFTQRVALIICCSTLGNLNLSATVTSQVFTAVQKKWYNTR